MKLFSPFTLCLLVFDHKPSFEEFCQQKLKLITYCKKNQKMLTERFRDMGYKFKEED